MTTITVQATYRNGVLLPDHLLDLPNNASLQLQVTVLPIAEKSARSLFGAFPELAGLTDDDFDWAKRLWSHGLEKEARSLDGLA